MSEFKLYDPDYLLKHVGGQMEIYNREIEMLTKLQEEQQKKILEVIDRYKPIFRKIKEEKFQFTHPNINYVSSKGPILGHDKGENSLIIYDISSERTVSVSLSNDEIKGFPLFRLVERGFYKDSMTGLAYVGTMIDEYVKSIKDQVSEAKQELENS